MLQQSTVVCSLEHSPSIYDSQNYSEEYYANKIMKEQMK